MSSIDQFLSRHTEGTESTFVKNLEKYKNNPTVFISFSHSNQLGISPFSEHPEPSGVYAFPLVDVWSIIASGKIPSLDPGMIKPFLHIIKIRTNRVLDLQKEISSDEYIQKINLIKNKSYKNIIEESSKATFPNKGIALYKSVYRNFKPKVQSELFKEMGYDVILDKNGVISKEEKMQAIFLTVESFEKISTIKINPEEMTALAGH